MLIAITYPLPNLRKCVFVPVVHRPNKSLPNILVFQLYSSHIKYPESSGVANFFELQQTDKETKKFLQWFELQSSLEIKEYCTSNNTNEFTLPVVF